VSIAGNTGTDERNSRIIPASMYRFYCNVAPLRQTWGEIAAILNTEVGADRGNRNARAEAIHLTHDDEVEEAEHGSAPMSSAVIPKKLAAEDWADDKWVEQPVRGAEASGSSDAGVPERADSADDWMNDKWVEERVQGAEPSGSPDTSLAMNIIQCEHIRRNTVPRQQSAPTPPLTILTPRSDRQHETLPVRQFVLRGRWGLSRGWRPIASYARNL
jgi:hypothetical protein